MKRRGYQSRDSAIACDTIDYLEMVILRLRAGDRQLDQWLDSPRNPAREF